MNLSEIKLQSIPETEKGIQTGFATSMHVKGEIPPYVLPADPKETILAGNPKLRQQLFEVQRKIRKEK